MKKYIFALLILMVGLVGLSAVPLHPSGGIPLEIAMSDGYGIVTPDMVLAVAPLDAVVMDSVILAEAVMLNRPSTAMPQYTLTVFVLEMVRQKHGLCRISSDFHLLC